MAKLVVLSKNLNGLSCELEENWTTIGRSDGNNFQLLEPSVSGRHCEVKWRGADLLVRDLLSTNGTFIAGKKITEGIVKSGETLMVGDVELRFENSPAVGTSLISKVLGRTSGTSPTANTTTLPRVSLTGEKTPPVNDGKKFQVLFVDDSMAFLETFSELCLVLSNNSWHIYTATTADKALSVLKETAIDLTVLDIGMPMVDGLQLLGIISRRYPGMKIAVMTGKPTEANRAACLSGGAELFIEKPTSTDSIKIVFNLLNDLVSWHHREGFSGAVRQVGLQEVIQMECIGRHSSILEVRNSQMRGQIYIDTGAVIHAATGNVSGERAFQQLLSLKGGEFQVQPFKAPPQRTIQGSWEVLLMEAARANDEETEFYKRKMAQPENSKPDNFVIVQTYERDGKWSPVEGEK